MGNMMGFVNGIGSAGRLRWKDVNRCRCGRGGTLGGNVVVGEMSISEGEMRSVSSGVKTMRLSSGGKASTCSKVDAFPPGDNRTVFTPDKGTETSPIPSSNQDGMGDVSVPLEEHVDVMIVGGGPAGTSLAAALGEHGVSVMLVDKALQKRWPNNYGVWMDEIEPLGLADCTQIIWPLASVYTSAERKVLDRPYGRMDVHKLKKRLMDRCEESGKVEIIDGTATNLEQREIDSNLSVQTADGQARSITSKMFVDTTGHAQRYVKFKAGYNPGVQTAYGMEITVKSHPWPLNEMLLMDFRSNHMNATEAERREADTTPLFFYVMPMSETRIFVEETSLIGRPPVDFDYLIKQCYKRLAYHNVEVIDVLEEEFCYIPMGGGLPELDQRVLGFGGTASLVHPATGYMLSTTLRRADGVAKAIAESLQDPRVSEDANLAARQVWKQIWSDSFLLQRDFLEFGGEVVLSMNLSELRDFQDAFFRLPTQQWSEFLSMGLIKPEERLIFGLGMFFRTTNPVRFCLVKEAILHGQFRLLNSVLPKPNLQHSAM